MLQDKLGKELLVFDGGLGTELQKRGLKAGEIPEVYNIEKPDILIDIHKSYLEAGADFVSTNTFGCNPYKMKESGYCYCDLMKAAIKNAKVARDKVNKNAYIALDLGPIGQMLKPMGTLSFDEAYEMYASQILIAKDEVDVVILETMSDLYEVKAAILAVKENSDLPIIVSMTFEENQRTLGGTDPLTFVNVVEGLGVSALGVNCSLGPQELKPIVEEILNYALVPVIVQPNAGLPCLHDNETHYEMDEFEFVEAMKSYTDMGVSLIGGCCGTTPAFIQQLSLHCSKELHRKKVKKQTMVSSQSQTVILDGNVRVCGERLNPTGKKKLKAALKEKRYEEYVVEGINQQRAGADILDVNVGLAGIDETTALTTVIEMLQEVIQLPLQIDSSSSAAIEKACRYYNGKPLINSVNAKDEVMDSIYPIAKKYGAVVIGLTLEEGIPLLAKERLVLAQKMVKRAKDYGIEAHNIVIDCLTLTASAQQREVQETLKALTLIKDELSIPTVLGVSNVSFGLPHRPLLNRTFLTLALQAGLDLPIINPLDKELMDTIKAYNVLCNKDEGSIDYIASVTDMPQKAKENTQFTLSEMIMLGLKDEVEDKTKDELESKDALVIINEIIIPSLNKVGEDYEKGVVFLPQLIQSAETTKLAFEVIKSTFDQGTTEKGPILMCTVEGDVHDIGKNIVKVVLESYGYRVIDLGKDVKVQAVIDAYYEYKPKMIGLSALMTTTVINMKKTIEALHAAQCDCPIWVGGAVLNEDIAKEIGADYYSKDAMASVELLNKVL